MVSAGGLLGFVAVFIFIVVVVGGGTGGSGVIQDKLSPAGRASMPCLLTGYGNSVVRWGTSSSGVSSECQQQLSFSQRRDAPLPGCFIASPPPTLAHQFLPFQGVPKSSTLSPLGVTFRG